MTTNHPRFSPEQCERLRQNTVRKSQETALKLSNILNQKKGSFAKMTSSRRASIELRERKTRQFLDLLTTTLNSIGSEDYGNCEACGDGLSNDELTAMPWATRCRRCPEISSH